MAFGPRNLGVPAATIAERVTTSLTAVGLIAERSTNPYDLDLSRRKLVALAGVLAMDPAVLVLDEPTTGQDADGLARVGAVVEAMEQAGRTVVAITHDMEFAASHFGRIVVMRDGVVVADGPPEQVFAPAGFELLASTGLTPPPAARIAARMGLDVVPFDADSLLAVAQSVPLTFPLATTRSRNDVSTTSIPAMTRATISGRASPSAQPAPAAAAARARKTSRTPRIRPGTSSRPPASRGQTARQQDDRDRRGRTDESRPDERRRMDDRLERVRVGTDQRGRDDRDAAEDEGDESGQPRGHDRSATSWTSPSTIRHALMPGAPVVGSASSSLSETRT